MEKDNKEKLIEAGEKLFAQKGLTGVSIRELSQAAGTNSALISYYFGGKEGLYSSILETQFLPMVMMLDSMAELKASPKEKIISYAKCVARIHRKSPFLTKFLMGELTNPSRFFEIIVRKYIERVYRFLTETLKEGIERGEFRPDIDVNAASLTLAGMMNFYFIARPISRHFAPGGPEQDDNYVEQAVEIFLNGVMPYEGK